MRELPFVVHDPAGQGARDGETPVIVEVPHAGVFVAPEFMPELLASARAIGKDADLYVDDLYEEAPIEGASLLVSRTSRYVVDLNRSQDDLDRESAVSGRSSPSPRGVVWRTTTEGDRALTAPLWDEALELRLSRVYRPYHATLRGLVERKLSLFGRAVILAAHSMPSVAKAMPGDTGHVRADVVPGTQGRTSAAEEYIDVVDAHARQRGWSVAHDQPYKGGFTTQHYGRPRDRVHVVQVELARRLYMNEVTFQRTPGAFDEVRAWCRALVRKLGEVD